MIKRSTTSILAITCLAFGSAVATLAQDVDNQMGGSVTHWSTADDMQVLGAEDQTTAAKRKGPRGEYREPFGGQDLVEITDPYVSQTPENADISYYVYPIDDEQLPATRFFVPRLNYYVGSDFDVTRESEGTVNGMLDDVAIDSSTDVTLLATHDAVPSQNVDRLQIIHGRTLKMSQADLAALPQEVKNGLEIDPATGDLIDAGIMFTVFLPPEWSSNDTGLPIVVGSQYGVGDSVFGGFSNNNPQNTGNPGHGRAMGRIIASSEDNDGSGAIGVIWNSGGSVGTFGRNRFMRYQFENLVDYLETEFGGDRDQIVFMGNSRGGSTSLILAANPEERDYTAKFVAGSSFGFTVAGFGPNQGGSLTFPENLLYRSVTTGFHDAWRPDFAYPRTDGMSTVWNGSLVDAINPHLVGLTGYQGLAANVFGEEGTVQELEGKPIIEQSVLDGFQAYVDQDLDFKMVLELSGHDKVGYFQQLDWVNALFEHTGLDDDNRVRLDITMRRGHGARFVTAGYRVSQIELQVGEVVRWLTGAGGPPSFDPGPHYYKINKVTGAQEDISPAPTRIPFTLDVPTRVPEGFSTTVVVTGPLSPAGSSSWNYRLRLFSVDTDNLVSERIGTMPEAIDNDHIAGVVILNTPFNNVPGLYRWEAQLTLEDGAQTLETVDLVITSGNQSADTDGAVTEVIAELPNVSGIKNELGVPMVDHILNAFGVPDGKKVTTSGGKTLTPSWGLSEH